MRLNWLWLLGSEGFDELFDTILKRADADNTEIKVFGYGSEITAENVRIKVTKQSDQPAHDDRCQKTPGVGQQLWSYSGK